MMKGVATDQFRVPSLNFVLPDDASMIASVQGVYTSLADLEAGTNSYYDSDSCVHHGCGGAVQH